MSHNGNIDDAHHTHAIQIDTDSSASDQGEDFHEFDSDSDGGMQIDQPESILQIAGGEIEFDAQVMGLGGDGAFHLSLIHSLSSFTFRV